MRRAIRAALALLLLVALAACTTLNVGTAVKLRALDLLNDDIASMVLALDVPEVLLPELQGSRVVLTATGADGEPITVEAQLIRSDAQNLAETLPPPAQDRGYYLFAFPDMDKQKIRDAQAEMRAAREKGGAFDPRVELKLDFCILAEIDPDKTYFSAHVALPGAGALEPLISHETVAMLVKQTGDNALPACADFSH